MNKCKIPVFKELAALSGSSPGAEVIIDFLNSLADGSESGDPFFSRALRRIREEVGQSFDPEYSDQRDLLRRYWEEFFPEALLIDRDPDEVIEEIREKRIVTITSPGNPPADIPGEMTFTSNVLLTIPDRSVPLDELDLPPSIGREIPGLMKEEQLYWFDHPVQMGEKPEKNEIIYGLKGLSESFAFEKRRGTVKPDARLDVLLSVSVTHRGLQKLAAPYMKYELSRCADINDLNIYIFTEEDCRAILESYSSSAREISRYFGVDGKYGRHYNFLKAVNALWKSAFNPNLKGTFKIDLDQVFPQRELVDYTGKSAFEHFQNPLWGSSGIDREGNAVDLSMIAGALVNESDIGRSLFTPDVSVPDMGAPLSDLVFFKHLSMALSTRAEMMTRYGGSHGIDGRNRAVSRIHVTGGTNGILIDALMKHRPFTPSFIGRAEDQAYLLSVLNSPESPKLRYYHEDGLVMRHDKHAFAGRSIEAAKDGTYIADILRVLYFTYYSRALPGGAEKTKESLWPFTGSYICSHPLTTAYMRLVFKILELHADGEKDRADALLALGKSRLEPLMAELEKGNFLVEDYRKEKEQWNAFYDEIEELNDKISAGDPLSLKKRDKLADVLSRCRIT